jgi:hypothetical protein
MVLVEQIKDSLEMLVVLGKQFVFPSEGGCLHCLLGVYWCLLVLVHISN